MSWLLYVVPGPVGAQCQAPGGNGTFLHQRQHNTEPKSTGHRDLSPNSTALLLCDLKQVSAQCVLIRERGFHWYLG